MKQICVRSAPSPTGFIHIGNLRTMLFTYLFARHNNGINILRIEDTDQNRLVEGAAEHLIKTLSDLGIEFDEGVIIKDGKLSEKGDNGPYIQSKRLGLYEEHIKKLLSEGHAYYCFCTQERLDELRKEQSAMKLPPMYDKLCLKYSTEEVENKLASNTPHVIRLKVPGSQTIQWDDIVFGNITFQSNVVDDQVLTKSDGFPTYHFAVVVDDHLMGITHVTRGEEWIPSTPKQILLYQMFGWEIPKFAHFPNIHNSNKTKLSKRHGDVSVEGFLKQGYLKEALINYIVMLGWNPKSTQEFFNMEGLIKEFDLSKINKAGAVFDPVKLDWMNSNYIRRTDPRTLCEMLLPFWEEAGYLPHNFDTEYLIEVAKLEQERLKKLSEIIETTAYFFNDPAYEPNLLVWKKSDTEKTLSILNSLLDFWRSTSILDLDVRQIEVKTINWIKSEGFDNGSVLWPLRVSLTGLDKSPGPFEVAKVLSIGLGKEAIFKRIEKAVRSLT